MVVHKERKKNRFTLEIPGERHISFLELKTTKSSSLQTVGHFLEWVTGNGGLTLSRSHFLKFVSTFVRISQFFVHSSFHF